MEPNGTTRVRAMPYDYYVMTEACPQEKLPRDGTYYILARNGVFIHKGNTDPDDSKQGLIESVTVVLDSNPPNSFNWRATKWDDPVSPNVLPGLLDCKTYANIKISKIPHYIAVLAQQFFANVLREMRSESEVQLYYSIELDRFELVCPEQFVSAGGVEYQRETTDLLETNEGRFLRAGTIHSHCDFMAFHSGTDTADEAFEDGIHITFGHNDQLSKGRPISIVSSVVANNHREPIDPAVCIEGVTHAYDQVGSGISSWWQRDREPTHFYNLAPLDDSLQEAKVLETVLEWMPRVERSRFWNNKQLPTRGRRSRRKNDVPLLGGGSNENISN